MTTMYEVQYDGRPTKVHKLEEGELIRRQRAAREDFETLLRESRVPDHAKPTPAAMDRWWPLTARSAE
jgi:hypothetical protein